MLQLNKRMEDILGIILKNENIGIVKLSESLGISKRTAYYDISKINSYLEKKKLSKIKKSKTAGLYIDDKDKVEIKKILNLTEDTNYIFSGEERVSKILLELLINEDKQTLSEYEGLLKVTTNTIQKDIKKAKQILKEFNLKLENNKGYKITGDEISKRTLFSMLYSSYKYLLPECKDLVYVRKKLESNFNKLETLSYIEHIYYHYYKKNNKPMIFNSIESYTSKFMLESSKSDEILKSIKKEYNIEINNNEKHFISLLLMKEDEIRNQFKKIEKENYERLSLLVKYMVEEFEKISFFYIDNKYLLEESILNHLIPCIVKNRVGIYTSNNLKKEIKEKYKSIYVLTKKTIMNVEQVFGDPVFSDDVICDIAMYFGGVMHGKVEASKIPKLIIVCNEGKATSQLLKLQIEDLFTKVNIIEILPLRLFKEITYNYDFVITTVDIDTNDSRMIRVNPILTEIDKSNLLLNIENIELKYKTKDYIINEIMTKIDENAKIINETQLKKDLERIILNINDKDYNDRYKLKELLNYDTVQVIKEKCSWEEAIELAAFPLLKNCVIEKKYVEHMIENVNKLGPYIIITDNVAMPHSRPKDGVNKLGISLTVFENEVEFAKSKSARIFITLAPIDNKSHLNMIAELNDLLSNIENINKLLECKNRNELVDIICKC